MWNDGGDAACFGNNEVFQTRIPTGISWATVDPGYESGCGVTDEGELKCWGRDGFAAWAFE